MGENAKDAKAHFLSISAELRNRIYEYALIEEKPIRLACICKPEYHQPALLRTCSQIRNEAISLFYTQNRFRAAVHGYDGRALIPFRRALLKHRASNVRNYSLDFCEKTSSWSCTDLAKWLEAYHADCKLVPGLRQDTPCERSGDLTLLRRTFGVVKGMLKRPWKQVAAVLHVFYQALVNMGEKDFEVLIVGSSDDDAADGEEEEAYDE